MRNYKIKFLIVIMCWKKLDSYLLLIKKPLLYKNILLKILIEIFFIVVLNLIVKLDKS